MAAKAKITHHLIEQRFAPIAVDSYETEACDTISNFFRETAHNIADVLPEGRYKSMVMTSLEEAMHWAQKSAVDGLRYNRPIETQC